MVDYKALGETRRDLINAGRAVGKAIGWTVSSGISLVASHYPTYPRYIARHFGNNEVDEINIVGFSAMCGAVEGAAYSLPALVISQNFIHVPLLIGIGGLARGIQGLYEYHKEQR